MAVSVNSEIRNTPDYSLLTTLTMRLAPTCVIAVWLGAAGKRQTYRSMRKLFVAL
jgi:hypothetical protein